ncbi:MAG: ParB N-terminal domain-containing protein [Planctomycetes bacterium]|nr:ParB N-terminal domain-containing protein [Planctomycetota bacterium]
MTIRLDDIRPSPENDRLYRPVDPDDPQIVRLAESIRDCGMQEPLLITRDGWIISGHRRYAAAALAGLEAVPCRVEPIYKDADHDTFMMLLRECNRQRVKSFDEKLREEVLSDSPDDAYQALLAHRRAQARRATGQVRSFEIVGTTSRARITRAKTPMLKAVRKVLADLRDFHPLSARQIHYALLNDPPLRHASKPDSVYRNDSASYKSLLDLLTRARLAGLVPMHQVADETRPVETWNVHADVQDYIAEELGIFLQTYRRDLLASQPNHIELVAEKNTVAPVVMPVAQEYCVPTTIGRGYCSLPPRAAMVERYQRSGKERFLLLVVSDFDPDGEEIAHSAARSLRDDFGVDRIEPVKVALTTDQVHQFQLPAGGKAKKTSRHYTKFTRRYGENVFELEALSPAQLQHLVRQSIQSVLDMDAFEREQDQERQDAQSLAAVRQVVRHALLDRLGDET